MSSRPYPKRPSEELALYLELASGLGVDFNRNPIKAELPGRRRKPRLVDLLDTARLRGVTRIVLCGDSTPSNYEWLIPNPAQIAKGQELTPGWRETQHFLGSPATGRFRHIETGHQVVISTTRDWFGDQLLSPVQAQFALETLRHLVGGAMGHPDWALMRTPSATGLNLWKASLDGIKDFQMAPIDPDLGREIQSTEPQHRNEIYTAGEGRCGCEDCLPLLAAEEIDGFCYADGRFMYHGVASSAAGAAPAVRLTGEQAQSLFAADPYHPARYQIRFTVPSVWDHLGILPVKRGERVDGWHWPNRPGAMAETWANHIEVRTAVTNGWQVEFLSGIRLTKTNVISPLANKCSRMLAELARLRLEGAVGDGAHQVVGAAVKHMFRVVIGSFSRRQRNTTRFAARFEEISERVIEGSVRAAENGGYRYEVPFKAGRDDADTWHPEVAAMVWGWSRNRVLTFTQALNPKQPRNRTWFGALEIEPGQLIGIQGDAIYTTDVVPWTLPAEFGGIDDGRNGKLRIKGVLPGPLATPHTLQERQDLSNLAEANGWEAAL